MKGRFQTFLNTESKVQQNMKDETDLNKILKKYARGIMPRQNSIPPRFIDISELPDYQDFLNMQIKTERILRSLPASVTRRFGNDPTKILEFLKNPENKEQAIKLGLLRPDEEEIEIKPPMSSRDNSIVSSTEEEKSQ